MEYQVLTVDCIYIERRPAHSHVRIERDWSSCEYKRSYEQIFGSQLQNGSAMIFYKSIFSGRLDFGTPRSYQQVIKMFEHRKENYYKSEVIFEIEDIFIEEEAALNIPRHIAQVQDKFWRNTVNLLKNISQYAVSGDLNAWLIEDGKILREARIEPESDKSAVRAFLQGRELINESGKESEAKEALSRAIEKFERHSTAYERRGFVNYRLRNYADALYDYSKSIDINPRNAEAYFGRAFVHIAQDGLQEAISDLQGALKVSIPLQPIYWKIRRRKAECHFKLNETEEGIKDLKMFAKRNFTTDNPNYQWRRKVLFDLGNAYLSIQDFDAARTAFDDSLNTPMGRSEISDSEVLLFRGMAAQKAGSGSFVEDWKEAAAKGSVRATELLNAVALAS